MIAVLSRTGLPVAYPSWTEWRAERLREAAEPPPPLVPAGSVFCAHCWGQARLLTPARNGEGLIPAPCPVCAGTGVVR